MKIALGAVAGTLGGPATYAVELTRSLARCFPEDELTVITDRPDLFDGRCRTIHVGLPSPWLQPLWDHVGVARALARGSFDLYHATKGILPRPLGVPGVVTIHDLAHKVLPGTFSLAQRIHLGLETPSTLARAAAVITDSASSAADISRFFGAKLATLEVIPLAAPERGAAVDAVRVAEFKASIGCADSRLIGYLGTIQPRKNLDVLVAAFNRAAGRRHDWVLAVAGRIRPGYRPGFLQAGDRRIRYLGSIADDEVPVFLSALDCMVSPSSYEGFGLSFLEAMAAGCPVIGVANSSIPEVVGEAGILVGEPDVESLADAMLRLMDDGRLAGELAEKGRTRAALFSWNTTARATRSVYERVCPGSGTGT